MAIFWVLLVIGLPWFPIYSSRSPSVSFWFLWAAVCATCFGAIYVFMRLSFMAHWAALRRNAPLASRAWRGVGGVYVLVTIIFGLPAFSADPSGTHRVERYLYASLVAIGLALSVVAITRGFRHALNQSA